MNKAWRTCLAVLIGTFLTVSAVGGLQTGVSADEYGEELDEVLAAGGISPTAMGANLISPAQGLGGDMDLETMLMLIHSQRSQLLDDQLKEQMNEVNARNQMTARLYELLGKLEDLREKPPLSEDEWILWWDEQRQPVGLDRVPDLESAIDMIQCMLDAASNSQQMDMLRLQRLSEKRDEAFDLMTDFVRKMQDSPSGIIGNMR